MLSKHDILHKDFFIESVSKISDRDFYNQEILESNLKHLSFRCSKNTTTNFNKHENCYISDRMQHCTACLVDPVCNPDLQIV